MFTEYLFDQSAISDLVEQRKKALSTNRGLSDFLGFGLGVIAGRLKKDPTRYRDYGPYWWALKEALNRNGYNYGQQSDEEISNAYRGNTDAETLVMADEFRSMYLDTFLVHSNQFMLDANTGEMWTLLDSDMESMKLAQ
ncbi:hypothetical protein [Nitrosomonas communis]|uniref:hypothetical protein n=1 Tax=Nitrosomonas communis TaxID=44574 RepID=UPI0026F34C03|nr:hypothetical protein [Nitrosomonas communis]MCO6429022.1 hypothetical protein [Nitrosomonas communis]